MPDAQLRIFRSQMQFVCCSQIGAQDWLAKGWQLCDDQPEAAGAANAYTAAALDYLTEHIITQHVSILAGSNIELEQKRTRLGSSWLEALNDQSSATSALQRTEIARSWRSAARRRCLSIKRVSSPR